MPTTFREPSSRNDRNETPAWIVLASMFAGQNLHKRAAIGAYVAVTAIVAVSTIILLSAHR